MNKIHHDIIVCSNCLTTEGYAEVWLTFRNVVPKDVNIIVPIGSVVLIAETHGTHKLLLNSELYQYQGIHRNPVTHFAFRQIFARLSGILKQSFLNLASLSLRWMGAPYCLQ